MYEKIYVSYFKPLYMSEAHQEQGPLPTFPCHELRGDFAWRKQSLTDTLHARTFVYANQDAGGAADK